MELTLLEKAVLVAVLKGVNTVGGLRKLINVDEEELKRIVEKLIAIGLLKKEKRGFIFKREVLVLTEKGFEEASKALKELEELAKSVEDRLEAMRVEERAEALNSLGDVAYIAPLLAWLGFIDLALLAPLGLLLVDDMLLDTDHEYDSGGADVEEF